MAYACASCGKTATVGRSRQHRRGVAGKRWLKYVTPTPRLFKPNLQKITITKDGKKRQVLLCGKCIKRLKFDEAKGKKSKILENIK